MSLIYAITGVLLVFWTIACVAVVQQRCNEPAEIVLGGMLIFNLAIGAVACFSQMVA